MKLKIEIKSWLNGSILFEYESENNSIKKTLEKAVVRRADLRGADLRGADLRGADLREADFWRADLRGAKNLKLYWHIHHEELVENLTEPLKNRIAYIKSYKPKDEIKLRLKLLKKVKCKPENYPHTIKGWEKLHKKECKNCPWDGHTIFPKG